MKRNIKTRYFEEHGKWEDEEGLNRDVNTSVGVAGNWLLEFNCGST